MTLARKYAAFLPLIPLLMGFYGVRNINYLIIKLLFFVIARAKPEAIYMFVLDCFVVPPRNDGTNCINPSAKIVPKLETDNFTEFFG